MKPQLWMRIVKEVASTSLDKILEAFSVRRSEEHLAQQRRLKRLVVVEAHEKAIAFPIGSGDAIEILDRAHGTG
jgi:hypothetical protein